MSVIGYVRFAKDADDAQAQHDHDLAVLGVDAIYLDRGGSRGGLRSALRALKVGDTLVIARLSQLGLGAGQMLKFAAALRFRGVHLASLRENLDTRDQRAALGWQFFSAALALLAMEKELAKQRADGGAELISIGPARGRNGGRPRKLDPRQVEEIRQELWRRSGRTPLKDIAAQFGICKQTLYTRVINTPDPGIAEVL